MGTAARDIVTIVQRAIAQSEVDMTGKPEDIPQDVWDEADQALVGRDFAPLNDPARDKICVARAIMAERERCAKLCDDYQDWAPNWGQHNNAVAAEAAARDIAAEIRK